MRCYFLHNGHIERHVPLDNGSDKAMIEQAEAEFKKVGSRYDGFEVWRLDRLLYRSPALTVPFMRSLHEVLARLYWQREGPV